MRVPFRAGLGLLVASWAGGCSFLAGIEDLKLTGGGDSSARDAAAAGEGGAGITYEEEVLSDHPLAALDRLPGTAFTHLVGEYDGAHLLLYVNGVLADAKSATFATPAATNPFVVRAESGGTQFSGARRPTPPSTSACPHSL